MYRALGRMIGVVVGVVAALGWAEAANAQVRFSENFENVGPTSGDGPVNLTNAGWIFRNQSSAPGINYWQQGDYIEDGYPAQSGIRFLTTATSWDAGTRRVSTWAILPPVAGQQPGDRFSIFVRGWTTPQTQVQLRYSPSGGTGTGSGYNDVGDFTVLVAQGSMSPHQWTLVEGTIPGGGRLAIRAYDPSLSQYYSPIVSVDTATVSATSLDAPIPGPGQTVVWTTAMSPVQIREVRTIPAGGTVIVEPGVTVNVQQEASLIVAGTLRALGTPSANILFSAAANYPPALEIIGGTFEAQHAQFTGQLRPSAGGNLTITDSAFTGPNGLIFSGLYMGTGFARIERTTFTNSELTISNYTLVLSDLTLNNTTMRMVRDYVFFNNISVNGRTASFSRENYAQPMLIDTLAVQNVTDGAGLGLSYGNFFVGPNVTITGSQYTAALESAGLVPGSLLPAAGNANNVVFLPGGDHGGALIWADPGIPYYVSAVYAQHGGSIRILPGVDVKLAPGAGMIADPADIRALGTESQPVTFTQAVPGGRFYPLQLFHRIRHAVIDGALTGGAWPACCGWGFVDSSIVRNCLEYGLRGQVIVRKTLFQNNGVGAFVSFTDDLLGETNPNAFEGNGIGVSDASNATWNWWNSPSGPTTPSNPGGTGDPVSAGVPYEPFRTTRPDFADAPPVVDLAEHSSIIRPGQQMILTWEAEDDGSIVSHRVLMATDGDVVQGNLIEPVIVLADNLPGAQRSLEFVVPEPGSRFFGHANIRVESVDNAGQIGWDDLHVYIERDEQGELVITTTPPPTAIAGQDLGQLCWSPQGISPFGGSVTGYIYLENSDYYIYLGGVTTYLNCLAGDLEAPFVSTDRARLVVSLFTGGGVAQPEYYFGAPFAIRPDPRVGDAAPAVTMTGPPAGASYRGATTVPISWTASDDQFVRAFHIQASTDGGRTWSFIERDLPGTATSYAWRLPPSDAGIPQVHVKVVAVDRRFQDSSAVRQIVVTPGSGGPAPCPADFNADGTVGTSDISAFLTAWFSDVSGGTLIADFNADGVVGTTDITAFLTAWFAAAGVGC
ncbi:MAG TPA: GC-type dockerin domain-anchored protein [Phycisphaerales bacterium]|nr:GC-type dockerin domain-anchored protein [Phycisphaerales bacterium]